MPKPYADLLADLRAMPMDAGVMENVADDLLEHDPPLAVEDAEEVKRVLVSLRDPDTRESLAVRSRVFRYLEELIEELAGAPLRRAPRVEIPPPLGNFWAGFDLEGGRRRSQTKRFGSCVKAVRKTVKARKGSNPESAAIAICTTTLLHPRGRTIKRYRKGRLLTQKRRR